MSRIGKLLIKVPDKVNVTINKDLVSIKGPKGELSRSLPNAITVVQNDSTLTLIQNQNYSDSDQLYGTYRSLLSNMIKGVTSGFQKKLELQGVGYRSQVDGKTLVLNVGYSHQVKILAPEGIKLSVDGNTNITVIGIGKEFSPRILH